VDKCFILYIGKSTLNRQFFINASQLPVVSSCRDLGVVVSNDLSQSAHINVIVAKAHQRANAILRCFTSRDNKLLIKVYFIYVRPLLEYNSVVWSPHLKQDIEKVEQVQRRFTKRLPVLISCTYSERLSRLDLFSLELRRLHIDLIWCYKIVFGIVDINVDDFFEHSPATATRGHDHKLYKHYSRKNARIMFFCERVVGVWNSLPPDVVDFCCLKSFARTIRTDVLTKFLTCF